MRTPTRDHHGQPMGTRDRHPDEIHVGDIITWTSQGKEWHGVITGREGQPYVEVWIVGDTRVYRRHVTQHQPGAWTPTSHSPAPTDEAGQRADALAQALIEHDWDDALAHLGITLADGLARWDTLVNRGWGA